MHTTRGTLSGNAQSRPYGEMLATDGVVRPAALVLLAIGVDNAGAYGMHGALTVRRGRRVAAQAAAARTRPAGTVLFSNAGVAARRFGARAPWATRRCSGSTC
jgi:hypothetical protein